MKFKIGNWYASKEQVRKHYGEYWKGILLKGADIAVIYNFQGARRTHYGDEFDVRNSHIVYVGEGKTGDQTLNARNAALVTAKTSGRPIKVFLDCGDVFKPKKLLFAGNWHVTAHKHVAISGRKVFQFTLEPEDAETADHLTFTFGALGVHKSFEADLVKFATVRQKLYADHGRIIRSRDNIVGEIGEYFAIKEFNMKNPDRPLIRLTGSHKDIDAIQTGTGKRYAIKTVSSLPTTTSNIWSKDLAKAVDAFLITHLDRDSLKPRLVVEAKVRQVVRLLKRDNYQGSQKLRVDGKFIKACKVIYEA